MEITTQMKLKRIRKGLYETPDGLYQIENDGYTPPRTDEQAYRVSLGDQRYSGGFRFDGIEYGAEEACWIILAGEQNLGMYDTLREAKQALARIYRDNNR